MRKRVTLEVGDQRRWPASVLITKVDRQQTKGDNTPSGGGGGPGSVPGQWPDNFTDLFDRDINRTVKQNEFTNGFLVWNDDARIAWGNSTDGHQWNVIQTGQIDTVDFGISDNGGAGVTSDKGFLIFDADNVSPNWTVAGVDYGTINAIHQSPDWTLESVIHFNHYNTFPGSVQQKAQMTFLVGNGLIWLSLSFTDAPSFDYSELLILETGDGGATTQQNSPDFDFAWGVPYHVKWEHSVTSGISRAKVWDDTGAEPDAWNIQDVAYDIRPFLEPEVIFNADLAVGPDSSLQTGNEPTDYIRVDFDYIYLYAAGTQPGSSSFGPPAYYGKSYGPVLVAIADGVSSVFTLPYPKKYQSGTLEVSVNGINQPVIEVSPADGTFSLGWIPLLGDEIVAAWTVPNA